MKIDYNLKRRKEKREESIQYRKERKMQKASKTSLIE